MMRTAIAAALIACTSALAPQQTRTAVLEASPRRALLQRLPAALALVSAPALAGDVEDLAPPSQEEIEAARIARKLAGAERGELERRAPDGGAAVGRGATEAAAGEEEEQSRAARGPVRAAGRRY